MSILMLELIGLFCMWIIIILLISIILEWNIFRKKLKHLLKIKTLKKNIFRIQACDSVMFRYFCIGFIDFMFKGKTLTEYTNLFSPNDFKKNDNKILSYFKNEWK